MANKRFTDSFRGYCRTILEGSLQWRGERYFQNWGHLSVLNGLSQLGILEKKEPGELGRDFPFIHFRKVDAVFLLKKPEQLEVWARENPFAREIDWKAYLAKDEALPFEVEERFIALTDAVMKSDDPGRNIRLIVVRLKRKTGHKRL